jgi:hypothetical protein
LLVLYVSHSKHVGAGNIAASLIGTVAAAKQPRTLHMTAAKADSLSAIEVNMAMRKFWEDHITWTRRSG